MKINTIIIISLILTIIFSCEKNEFPNFDSSCVETRTTYNENTKDSSWVRYYYTDGYNTKFENSYGDIMLYDYDGNGNIILKSKDQIKLEYVYDHLNNLIEMRRYVSGQLSFREIFNYYDNQLYSFYTLNESNDTTDWNIYYYENGLLSYVETMKGYKHKYYYSSNVDSILYVDEHENILTKKYLKYLGGEIVYDAYYSYVNNEISFFERKTWEYNNQLLMKYISELFTGNNDIIYDERRYKYENNLLTKEERYIEPNNLFEYYINIYDEEEELVRINKFNNGNTLRYYTLIENTCS